MTELTLVVGLGNPGDRYVGTRHNVGWEVLDALVRRLASDPPRPTRIDRLDCRALTGRVRIGATPVLLAKPQTYMNLSGESVKGLLLKHAVPPERMLVVSDDVALPVGRLRIRPSGSSGGQKGLQNVIDCLGSDGFPRLRIGIAGDHFRPGEDKADYVLERFSKAERAALVPVLATACEAIETFVAEGLDVAMNRFNRSPEPVPAS
ncbi:MAG TPA: aminoacyl-tRNA hydrolase [Thermoanaerobaculia bacterium]|nr:aminoacyl-tRNA hydrolase [Thermoanaerobaculia bacterium]